MESYRCACAFGKVMKDRDPTQYPRVGISDNVLYRGNWIVEHKPSGTRSVIGMGRGVLVAEADTCCFDWFDSREGQ